MIETIEQAERFARAVYPELADATFEIPEQGQDYFTLMTDQEVIKMPKHSCNTPQAALYEINVLKALASTDMSDHIPRVIQIDSDHQIMRLSRLKGEPLSEEVLKAMPAEERKAVATKIGNLIGLLQSQKIEIAEVSIQDNIRKVQRKIQTMKQTVPVESAAILDQVAESLDELKTKPAHILNHGDLNFGNIIYDHKSGKVGLIDFVYAGYTPHNLDCAKALLYDHIDDFVDNVFAGYEEASGQTLDQQELWLHYIAYNIDCGIEMFGFDGYDYSVELSEWQQFVP